MKRFLNAILALAVLFTCAANDKASGGERNYRLALGTSAVGSTYYILGTGWGNIMKAAVPGVEVSIEATPGGITNMQSMRNGDMDLGMTTCWLAGDGREGTGWAEGTKYDNCLSLFPTHNSVLYIFTLADSGINSISELEGKRIATGPLGSTSGDAVPLILDALGITAKNIVNLSSIGTCDALKDGLVDVCFGVTGVPASWLLDLETTKDIKIIPLSQEEIAKILAAQPFWSSGSIAGGVYKKHDADIPCIAYWNMVVANESLPESLVYNLCKATYENIENLAKVDRNAHNISYENVATMTMPLHPGALKYYTEQGVEIPASLKR